MVCFYGVDPRTGACKPNPLGSLLPPGIAGVLGNQQVLLPQETLVVLVILGLVCAVVASNLLTQARPVTWAEIYQLPEARGTVVPWWPQATPTSRPEHTFFFSDVGPYIPRGTDEIVADLEMYGLPGMAGSVSQLTSAQNSFDTGATWMIDILMGRKFEAERAIFFASRGALVQMNVSAPHYDLITRSFGPIQYVEVKWSRGPMPADTIRDVIESARTHPSGIYLVESNNIDEAARETLEEYGGTELPYPYP